MSPARQTPILHITNFLLLQLTELKEADRKKEENKIKMVFRLFDKDKDGYLNADELSDALRYAISLSPNYDLFN